MPDPFETLLEHAEPIAHGIHPLLSAVTLALEELKAQDIVTLPISDISTLADAMIVATGTSTTHVRAIAQEVVEQCKSAGYRPMGVEGKDSGKWVLIDLGDVIVHVMLAETRTYYDLESLWTARPTTAPGDAN